VLLAPASSAATLPASKTSEGNLDTFFGIKRQLKSDPVKANKNNKTK
jgi:hypothetical protein